MKSVAQKASWQLSFLEFNKCILYVYSVSHVRVEAQETAEHKVDRTLCS